MEGRILDYNSQKENGLIRGNDGNRYEFNASDVRSQSPICVGETVDFKSDGENAFDIYIIKVHNFPTTSGIISGFTNEENINKITQKAKEIINQSTQGGNHNTLGFTTCLMAIITLFLPLVKEMQIEGKYFKTRLIEDSIGVISLFLLIVLAYLFYKGSKRIQTKFLTGITSGLLLCGVYDMFEPMRDLFKLQQQVQSYIGPNGTDALTHLFNPNYVPPKVSFFDFTRFGFFIIIPVIIALLFVGFMGRYQEKS